MGDHFVLRPIAPADLHDLVTLEEASFSDPWSEEQLRAALGWIGVLGFAVEAGPGELVSYLLGRVVVDQGEILTLATLEAWRRQGLARRLLVATLAAMRERGANTVWLEVRQSNAAARALYEAAGFVATAVRRGYYRDPVEDALVLRRDLEPSASAGSALR
jgi:ribosomal-protein-alanine N-acetyltransferase